MYLVQFVKTALIGYFYLLKIDFMATLTVSPELKEEVIKVLGKETEKDFFAKFENELSYINVLNSAFEQLTETEKLALIDEASQQEFSIDEEFKKYGAAGYDFELNGNKFEASIFYEGTYVLISKIDKTRFDENDNYIERFFGIAPRGNESKLLMFDFPVDQDYKAAKEKALALISKTM